MQAIPQNTFNTTQEIYRRIRSIGLGISVFAFLVRSFKLGLISLEKYRDLKAEADREFLAYVKREEEQLGEQKNKDTSGGPSYYLLQVNKNGRLFTQIVLSAYKDGLIEPTQASSLLHVKVNGFQRLEAQLNK
jgi:hypothetical protein